MDLTGKVAIVTGSGRGLGLVTELARNGAAVVVNAVDDAEADAAVKTITAAGGLPSPRWFRWARPRLRSQAIGIGGDRLVLGSRPGEVVVEFAEGTGWSADAIAQTWTQKFAAAQQTVGQQMPEPPK